MPEIIAKGRKVDDAQGARYYEWGLEKFPSVTTILKESIPKPGIATWQINTIIAAVIAERDGLFDRDDKDVKKFLSGLTDASKDFSSAKGTVIHKYAESYATGAELPQVSPEEEVLARQFTNFCYDWRPKFLFTEVPIYSRTYGYAGTPDGVVEINGKNYIIDYKGLPLETPIPTVSGWSTMADLRVGDEVYDRTGSVTKILAKSSVHTNPCYRIRFDDGSETISDEDHLWLVYVGQTFREKILSTSQISGLVGVKLIRTPVAQPIEGNHADLKVEPYLLGVWLGDGKHSSGEISLSAEGLEPLLAVHHQVGKIIPSEASVTAPSRTVYGLHGGLKELGLLGIKRKAIPSSYLRASFSQRLSLLQGLMDSDGSWNKPRKRAVFVNTNKQLIDGIFELLCSLGQKPHINPYTAHGFGKTVQSYSVEFTPLNINPFRVERKRIQAENNIVLKDRRSFRVIRSVERVPIVRTHVSRLTRQRLPTFTGENSPSPTTQEIEYMQKLLSSYQRTATETLSELATLNSRSRELMEALSFTLDQMKGTQAWLLHQQGTNSDE